MGRTGDGARRFAIPGVLGKQQLQRGLAHVAHFVAGSVDRLARRRQRRAARQEASAPAILDHTDETTGVVGYFFMETQARDRNPFPRRHREDGLPRQRADGPPVDGEFESLVLTHHCRSFTPPAGSAQSRVSGKFQYNCCSGCIWRCPRRNRR
ncbi:hypothetical protein SDC9_163606 [bioreactor metagenome]|uniref:Uncharacterized protein n=1 Tax=bioreactor metagenome TaxID=1076179 RepID=A0A645FPA6_9ZZZZ